MPSEKKQPMDSSASSEQESPRKRSRKIKLPADFSPSTVSCTDHETTEDTSNKKTPSPRKEKNKKVFIAKQEDMLQKIQTQHTESTPEPSKTAQPEQSRTHGSLFSSERMRSNQTTALAATATTAAITVALPIPTPAKVAILSISAIAVYLGLHQPKTLEDFAERILNTPTM